MTLSSTAIRLNTLLSSFSSSIHTVIPLELYWPVISPGVELMAKGWPRGRNTLYYYHSLLTTKLRGVSLKFGRSGDPFSRTLVIAFGSSGPFNPQVSVRTVELQGLFDALHPMQNLLLTKVAICLRLSLCNTPYIGQCSYIWYGPMQYIADYPNNNITIASVCL